MPSPQLDEHLLARLVLEALEVLEGQCLDRVHFVFGQVRPAQDVGVDFEGGGQVSAERRCPRNRMCIVADALVAVEPEVVQGQGQFPAVPLPAPRMIRSDRTDAIPTCGGGS